MLRVGLTGGLSSGKSTVAKLFEKRGAVVFDADRIVHELYAPGGAGAKVARDIFGDAILDSSGEVDRSLLASLLFADPRKRHDLEGRIHPLVAQEVERRFADAELGGTAVGIAEVSQLLEARTESRYDRVALVVAPEAARLARWEAKGGDPADARRRMDVQIPPSQAFDRVDDVIVNDGTVEQLEEKVEEVWQRWREEPPSSGWDG
jgi:dephospho-CoA kinase